MSDLKNPNLIVIKGALFLLLGMIAALFLILKTSRLDVAILLLITIWAFCRFYYFAFYVIEHYVTATTNSLGFTRRSFICAIDI